MELDLTTLVWTRAPPDVAFIHFQDPSDVEDFVCHTFRPDEDPLQGLKPQCKNDVSIAGQLHCQLSLEMA